MQHLDSTRFAKLALAAAVCVALLLRPSPALPCTAFLIDQDGSRVFGKSYDWHTSVGMVIINKRGIAKKSLVLSPGDTAAEWTSIYASVSFNQYGREFSNGGMNEAGLALEVAVLNATENPAVDARPTLNEGQWVQYALDNFATVAELAAAAPSVRISPVIVEAHFLACDRTGACAAFEFLDGHLVITQGGDMVVNTLTNSTYASSAAYLANHEGFGGDDPIPGGSGSLDRFVRASAMALADHTTPHPDPAFAILDSVSAGSSSVWNIAYDLQQGRAYWRTYAVPTIKSVDLGAFDPDCTSDTMILDIDTAAAGDVTASFVPYSYGANTDLCDAAFAPIAQYMPSGIAEIAALYPDQQLCTLPPDEEEEEEEEEEEGEGGDDPELGDGGCALAGNGGQPAGGMAWLLLCAGGLALVRRLRPARR